MSHLRLQRPPDWSREHVRGVPSDDAIVIVSYEDFLCPFCRRLHKVFQRLRSTLGDRLVYVFRHFPNERAHPGAELAARAAEAAGLQGRFFEMHDWLFGRKPPFTEEALIAAASELGLDVERFQVDLASDDTRDRVAGDRADGQANGVAGTPTTFIDGLRYDGAWDYHSLLEALERPLAARVQRSARAFASLPTSAGLILLVAALLAVVCANTPLAPLYARAMDAPFTVGLPTHAFTMSVRDWVSEGLLSFFFLLVGLEIRRETTTGELTKWRAAALPIIAAFGGVVTPALLYLVFAHGPASSGWAVPTATDVAFALGLMAILGDRVPASLRVFVAALAVVDDMISMATLAIFYPRSFAPAYLPLVALAVGALVALNRSRVYATWPYVGVTIVLWGALHALGVHGALSGIVLAAVLPTRPPPAPAPLLAQAATALAALEQAEQELPHGKKGEAQRLPRDPVWEWSMRNLVAASERLSSPAERVERALAPWSAFVVLPIFAFSAAGIGLTLDLSARGSAEIFRGVVVGLVVGKPLGVLLSSSAAVAARVGSWPEGVTARQFVGAAFLCGIADTMALLVADRAFAPEQASVAKMAALVGSIVAGGIGAVVLATPAPEQTPRAASVNPGAPASAAADATRP